MDRICQNNPFLEPGPPETLHQYFSTDVPQHSEFTCFSEYLKIIHTVVITDLVQPCLSSHWPALLLLLLPRYFSYFLHTAIFKTRHF
jgi:hypothetical protein